MTEGVIYRYKSPSGKYYIGQTVNEEKRRRNWFNQNKIYGGPKINKARKKYGPENFEYTILMKVTGDDPEEVKKYLNTLEIGFIKMYDSYNNGYNSCDGGASTLGYHHTDDAKRRIGYAARNRQTGKKATDETKQKMSKSHKGKVGANLGRHWSEDVKKKLRDAHKGKKRGPYNKKKDGITHYPLW